MQFLFLIFSNTEYYREGIGGIDLSLMLITSVKKIKCFLGDFWFVLRTYPIIHSRTPEPLYWVLIVIGLICISIAIITYVSQLSEFPNSIEALGQMGDFFGGVLNPVFAGITFSALLYTIHLQHKAIYQNKLQLDLVNETQELQQFDNLFFSLVNQMTLQIDKFMKEGSQFNSMHSDILNRGKCEARQLILSYRELSNFNIFLYQILKNIDLKLKCDRIKKDYSNIVRSLLPNPLLQLLIINCYFETKDHNFDNYKRMMTNFSFFEHITFPSNIKCSTNFLNAVAQYEDKAFGENPDYIKFKKSIFYNKLKLNHNIYELLVSCLKNSRIKLKYRKRLILKELRFSDSTSCSGNQQVEEYYAQILFGENVHCLSLFFVDRYKYKGIMIDDVEVHNIRFEQQQIFLSNSQKQYYLTFKYNDRGGIVID